MKTNKWSAVIIGLLVSVATVSFGQYGPGYSQAYPNGNGYNPNHLNGCGQAYPPNGYGRTYPNGYGQAYPNGGYYPYGQPYPVQPQVVVVPPRVIIAPPPVPVVVAPAPVIVRPYAAYGYSRGGFGGRRFGGGRGFGHGGHRW